MFGHVDLARGRDELVADPLRLKEVHAGAAEERRHEGVGRSLVELFWRGDLLELATRHDSDPMAHRHRLDLVVRHVDGGGAEPSLEAHDVSSGLHTKLGVEIGERLIHQEHLWISHDGPGECDSLALPARELAGLAIEQLAETERACSLGDLGGARSCVHPLLAERELDVPRHRHVGIEGVALEDHRHVSVFGVDIVDDVVADREAAVRDLLEACDHAQRGRLAAARGAEQHQ